MGGTLHSPPRPGTGAVRGGNPAKRSGLFRRLTRRWHAMVRWFLLRRLRQWAERGWLSNVLSGWLGERGNGQAQIVEHRSLRRSRL